MLTNKKKEPAIIQMLQQGSAGSTQIKLNDWAVEQQTSSSSEIKQTDLALEEQAMEKFASRLLATTKKDTPSGSVDEKLLLSLLHGIPLLP